MWPCGRQAAEVSGSCGVQARPRAGSGGAGPHAQGTGKRATRSSLAARLGQGRPRVSRRGKMLGPGATRQWRQETRPGERLTCWGGSKERPHRAGSLGAAPGAAVGSLSPSTGRQAMGRQLDRGGLAPRSQPDGEEHPPRTGRQGPRTVAAGGYRPRSAAAQSPAKAKVVGRDWPVPRLRRRSGATQTSPRPARR